MSCRLCHTDGGVLIKYGVRHYAHARCFLLARVAQPTSVEKVAAALDQLSIAAIDQIPVLPTFDDAASVGSMAAIGMTTRQFMDYVRARRTTERAIVAVVEPEPHIVINGSTLTNSQAMTVRTALESFAMSLTEGLGDDDHGRYMTEAYRARIDEIRKLIFRGQR